MTYEFRTTVNMVSFRYWGYLSGQGFTCRRFLDKRFLESHLGCCIPVLSAEPMKSLELIEFAIADAA